MNDSSSDIADWNRIADTYAQIIGTSDDHIYGLFKTVLWESLGDLQGMSVLDLGCGHGWLSQLMSAHGASVLGIDGSAELLKKAQQACPEVQFTQHDLLLGLTDLGRRFDRIVAYMVLMDIPEIDVLMKSVREALNEAGKFIFILPHPCYFNYKSHRSETTGQMYCAVTSYLQPEVWRIESYGGHSHYHRSLTAYFELLRANQFAVTRLYEPPQMITSTDPDDIRLKIPKFLLIECIGI
jgi:2-polyprenyl-3-methyl-5-hydroxy-6-metoxy-1,4-benzoquinol methylase